LDVISTDGMASCPANPPTLVGRDPSAYSYSCGMLGALAAGVGFTGGVDRTSGIFGGLAGRLTPDSHSAWSRSRSLAASTNRFSASLYTRLISTGFGFWRGG
jgi:hypothetical protein